MVFPRSAGRCLPAILSLLHPLLAAVILSGPPGPVPDHQLITVTVWITAPQTPPASVHFIIGQSDLGAFPVVNGRASLTRSLPSPGVWTYQVTAAGITATLPVTVTSVLPANGFRLFSTPHMGVSTPAGRVLVADFNADGKADLAISTSALLADGSGNFPSQSDLGAEAAAVADFNLDGFPDIATASGVLLGSGNGQFQPPRPFPAALSNLVAMVQADFNGDGLPDLVAIGSLPGSAAPAPLLLLGVGGGMFQLPVPIPFQQALNIGQGNLAVADINGDGKPDLVILTGSSVSTLLGNGDGTFSQFAPFFTNNSDRNIAVADLNGDGKPDLIVTSNQTSPGTVNVLLGVGGGNFQFPVAYTAGIGSEAVLVADLNGDGKLDVVVSNAGSPAFSGNGSVSVLYGNGDGTLQAAVSYSNYISAAETSQPYYLAAADFNGDGRVDLAISNSAYTSIFLGAVSSLSIAATTLPPASLGAPYTAAFTATGGTAPYPAWSLDSVNAPPGLTLDFLTGVLSGTPTSPGPFTFDVSARDSAGNLAPIRSFTMNVTAPPLVISTASLPAATLSAAYSATLTAAGGAPPYTNWTVTSGSLPIGLLLNAATGVITGIPSAPGASTLDIGVKDSLNTTVSKTFVLTVSPPGNAPQSITFNLALAAVPLSTGSVSLMASATSGLAVTFSSTTPSICTVSGTVATLVAIGSCIITASQTGNVTWAAATPVTRTLTVSLHSPPPDSLTSAPATLTFTAQGGSAATAQNVTLTFSTAGQTAPTWAVFPDSPWLTPSPFTGLMTATGSPSGGVTTYTATVSISAAAAGLTAAATLNGNLNIAVGGIIGALAVTFTVTQPPPPSLSVSPATLTLSASTGGAPVSQNVTLTLTATNPAALSFTASSPAAWIAISPASGTLTASTASTYTTTVSMGASPGSVTATQNGTVTFSVAGVTASLPVTFKVSPPAVFTFSPASLAFTWRSGAPPPAAQSVAVSSKPAGAAIGATPSTTAGGNWLAVSTPASTPANLSVSLAPSVIAALPPGAYSGAIALAGSTTSLPVTLTVISADSPVVTTGGVVPIFGSTATIQPGSWVSIYGTNLAPSPQSWNGDFPFSLGGVSVTVNGKPAYLWFVSPTQINLQAPDDTATGPVPVVVTTPAGSVTSTVKLAPISPSLSLLDATHVAALTPLSAGAYAVVGTRGAFSFPTVPVGPGAILVLYGVGFGPTTPSVKAGQQPPSGPPAHTTNPVTVTIGGKPAKVSFAGPVGAGLFQINVTVPIGLAAGDYPVQATVGGVQTRPGIMVTVQ